MEVSYNPNFTFLHDNWDKNYICLQGSSRSGKTYSIYQFIIRLFEKYPNAGIEVDVVRDSLPVLKATIVKEFVALLQELGLYSEDNHNMTEKRITIHGNYFNYYSVDNEIKARGRKRHILWLNEPNNISRAVVDQLLIRTTHKVVIDFNPSEPVGMEHWLYDDILNRAETATLITTFRDNPFLTPLQIKEIEKYELTDPDFFQVFGKGERGAGRKGQILKHIKKCFEMPQGVRRYGLDFGKSNDPTALVECVHFEGALYANELIYQTGITATEIAKLMKQQGVSLYADIIADSAEPLMIEEIKRAGFVNIRGSRKGAGSVTGGIDRLLGVPIFAMASAVNLWREINWYSWRVDSNGVATNEPIDLHNHLIDSLRYCESEQEPIKVKVPILRR